VVGVVPQPQLIKAPFLVHVLLLAEELCTYGNLKLTPALVQTGGMVMWWIDMDHLVAELGNEHISMSLKDNLLDHLNGNSFSERRLEHARKSLWKELVLRYENRPDIDGLFDNTVKEKIAALKLKAPEPAFEFAEEFGG